jgi:hypothetical protein
VRSRLALELVEHRARLCCAGVHDGGAKALHHDDDAVRGDPFLLACPRSLSVSHRPAVWIAAALSDSLREDSKAACDKLTRARFGRHLLIDGAHRAASTAYADDSNECGQEKDRRSGIHCNPPCTFSKCPVGRSSDSKPVSFREGKR